jgi:hypothetical protein
LDKIVLFIINEEVWEKKAKVGIVFWMANYKHMMVDWNVGGATNDFYLYSSQCEL